MPAEHRSPISCPLTPNQQGLLFHYLSADQDKPYFIQYVYDISEPLDPECLRRAWQAVVANHASLRTSVQWEGLPQPLQTIHAQLDAHFDMHSWTHLAAGEQEEQLLAFLEHDQKVGFDLRQPPLHRLNLFELGPDRWRLVWSISHLICDEYSNRRVERELLETYDALRAGKAPPLQPSAQYPDYVRWFFQQDFSEAESYWRKLLSGFDEPTRLGIDGTGNAGRGVDASAEFYQFPDPTLWRDLDVLAQQQGLSRHVVALTGFLLLAGRYSRESDVVVGTLSRATWPGRAVDGSVLGFLVNGFPVRANLDPERTLESLLADVRTQLLRTWGRRRDFLPTADIYRCSDVPSGVPLYELVFNFVRGNPYAERPRWARVLARQHSNYPLEMAIFDAEHPRIKYTYSRARFDPDLIEHLASHYTALLQDMASRPRSKLKELRILQQEEVAQLTERTRTAAEYERDGTIHQAFSRQVSRTPGAAAVITRTTTLTYAELDRRSSRFADHLRSLGLPPGAPVGLCLERDATLLAGLLGILKAGHPYVPLDPNYPTARLRLLVEDSGAAVVVAEGATAHAIAPLETETLWLDDIDLTRPGTGTLSGNSEDLAYIIYTSGSTGTPKGVMLSHRNVMHFFRSMDDYLEHDPPGSWLAVTSICFDISVLELLWTLARGFTVVLGPELLAEGGKSLARKIHSHRVTHFQCTPSLARILVVENESRVLLKSLKQVLLGGEPLSPALLHDLHRLLPSHTQILNMYGPTEATVWATVQPLEGTEDPVLIGHPIANTYVYVLDEHQQPVPAGIPGELFIGGEGVAPGYWGRAELTKERFVPDPFAPHLRLYRTGDLGRLTKDGALEFLGRDDEQVKILGHRVELGEIAAVLQRHPGVREAVVVASSRRGTARLVGYYVADEAQLLDPERLLAYLRAELPDYMVPFCLVEVPAIPLTLNGKIDRRALPPPREMTGEYRALLGPRDELERFLAELWCRLLDLDTVAVNTTFFALGGNSLTALLLVAKIREVHGHDLAPSALLQAPTIEQLAEEIRRHNSERGLEPATARLDSDRPPQPDRLVRLQPARKHRRSRTSEPFARGYRRPKTTSPPIVFLHPALGTVLCYFELANRLGSDQPFYAIQATELPADSVEQLAEAYVEEVQQFAGRSLILGGWSTGGVLAFETARRLRELGKDVPLLVLVDPVMPPDDLPFVADRSSSLAMFGTLLSNGKSDFSARTKEFDSLERLDQLSWLRDELRKANLAPEVITLSEMERLYQTFRQTTEMVSRYRPRHYSGRTAIFQAKDHPKRLGLSWPDQCDSPTVREIPGDHYSVIHRPEVASTLRELLLTLG